MQLDRIWSLVPFEGDVKLREHFQRTTPVEKCLEGGQSSRRRLGRQAPEEGGPHNSGIRWLWTFGIMWHTLSEPIRQVDWQGGRE
jgi:hypothetical protein